MDTYSPLRVRTAAGNSAGQGRDLIEAVGVTCRWSAPATSPPSRRTLPPGALAGNVAQDLMPGLGRLSTSGEVIVALGGGERAVAEQTAHDPHLLGPGDGDGGGGGVAK